MKYLMILSLFMGISLGNFAQTAPKKIKRNREYTTQSGLKFKLFAIHKKEPKADSNDFVSVNYVGKLADGTVFDESYSRKMPISFKLGQSRVIKGWEEGLKYLHQGDSALFIIPPELGYGARNMGNIPANSTLYFTVKMEQIKKAQKPFDVKGLDTVKLADGLEYIRVAKGKGKKIEEGDKAFVQYTGYFTDGRKFDSSHDDGRSAFDFIIGRHRVIQGWEKGIVGMKKGEKRRLLIPYKLAYGENGRSPIPPKADLIFDIELEKFEKIDYPHYKLDGKDTITLPSGLKYIVIDSTTGIRPLPYDTVTIQYVARLQKDNKIFDSSYDRGDSLQFVIAAQRVIKGLDYGIMHMRKGETFRFIIPYQLGYGEKGREPIIPAKATLIFDVYLQNISKGKPKL